MTMAGTPSTTKRKKVYFMHPINTYGTPLETKMLALIATKFPGYDIVNPADQMHADKVAELRRADPKANVMPYFTELARSCDTGVVLPFGDGMWGAGICGETDEMLANGKFVWVINPTTVTFVPKVPPNRRLSIEETRARIRNPDGSSKPYA